MIFMKRIMDIKRLTSNNDNEVTIRPPLSNMLRRTCAW